MKLGGSSGREIEGELEEMRWIRYIVHTYGIPKQ